MRITGHETPTQAQRPENAGGSNAVSHTKSSKGVEHSSEVSTADRVELSSQARYIQRAQEVAQAAPEIREDRVETARRALQNGTLNLSGKALADKLVQDALPS